MKEKIHLGRNWKAKNKKRKLQKKQLERNKKKVKMERKK